MKNFIFAIYFIFCNFAFSQNIDLTKYVNPFIGTGGHGHTYPGATVPFGMVQLSPDTRLTGWDGCGGYHYSDSFIYGFSHTHLSGTGVPDYCDILLMPTNGTPVWDDGDYISKFNHQNEKSSAGYYSVLLDRYKIYAELTATKRCGFHRYKFTNKGNENIILDLVHRNKPIESKIQIVGNNEVRGYRRSTGWARNKIFYFAIKFSKPFDKYGIIDNDIFLSDVNDKTGEKLKAYVTFNNNEEIMVKVGLSAVSIEGAVKNLEAEIPDWDFDKVKQNAKDDWNKELNKIQVEGGTKDQKIVFYTALYHTMVVPNLYMDVDGQFRGTDLQIHKAENFENYTVFSLWDTYRAYHPLITIIDQKRTRDYINTFLKQYECRGLLPVWELSANETFCMIGYHSVPVIVDAYIKGIRGFDLQFALKAMKHSADTNLFGLQFYRQYGFVPQDKEHESVSKTLEYGYDDWCIAQFAKDFDVNDYTRFIERAQSYKNIFDPSTGMMRAKINGGWYKPFNPYEVNSNYTEADAWQYSFYVPQDMTGFIKLHGGKEKLAAKLDTLFTTTSNMVGTDLSDISGMIGQYAHGNEPSHHMAYLYNYVNQPWKTQELIYKINTEFYKNDPDGLIGNEDCGQMSAWFVMSAMGFYQVCPGQLQYAIGTPLFDKVTINLENGKKFIIKAENLSDKNYFIQSASMNRQKYNKCYLMHSDIMDGKELIFKMGAIPNQEWGSRDEDVPVTEIKDSLIVPVPLIEAEKKSFIDSQKIEIVTISPEYTISRYFPNKKVFIDGLSSPVNFIIRNSDTIFVQAMNLDNKYSKMVSAMYSKIPGGRNIKLISKYSSQYSGGGDEALIDLQRGEKNWRLGGWQGYLGQDFEAIVDLGKIQKINKVYLGCLQDVGSWICFPTVVYFEGSTDGINFSVLGTVDTKMNIESKKVEVNDFGISVESQVRYIRIKAMSFGKLPKWHEGAGYDSWIFVDEIILE